MWFDASLVLGNLQAVENGGAKVAAMEEDMVEETTTKVQVFSCHV